MKQKTNPCMLTGYNDSVFVNCPFDEAYKPLMYAIIYTIYRCGFLPRTALQEDDGTDFRLHKILRCIACCRYGIHDISRVEYNERGLPRFNMPFEAGLFFAAKHFGNGTQKNKQALIFERDKYLYQQYISDLNGIDTKAHQNDPERIIEKVRDWLRTVSGKAGMPGSNIIKKEFGYFIPELRLISTRAGLDAENLSFSDFCQIVENAVKQNISLDV